MTEVALVKLNPSSGFVLAPTSTHFLRSEALASHARGLAPASDGNIATNTDADTDTDTDTAQATRHLNFSRGNANFTPRPRPPPLSLNFAAQLQHLLPLASLRATGVDFVVSLVKGASLTTGRGSKARPPALRPAPSRLS